MGLKGRSRVNVAAGAASVTLAGLVVAHRADLAVSSRLVAGVAVAALALALIAAARTAGWIWRGPPLRPFPNDEAMRCSPRHAAIVRASAQLRGTLGGAGHVHRARLALSALGWLAAAGADAAVWMDPRSGGAALWGGAALAFYGAAAAFPARPFYYREAMDGRIVVHPRDACMELLSSESQLEPQAAADVPGAGDAAEADGWGSSLMPPATGGKHTDVRVD